MELAGDALALRARRLELLRRDPDVLHVAAQHEVDLGVGDVCFFLTMRCFNDAMFSNS